MTTPWLKSQVDHGQGRTVVTRQQYSGPCLELCTSLGTCPRLDFAHTPVGKKDFDAFEHNPDNGIHARCTHPTEAVLPQLASHHSDRLRAAHDARDPDGSVEVGDRLLFPGLKPPTQLNPAPDALSRSPSRPPTTRAVAEEAA